MPYVQYLKEQRLWTAKLTGLDRIFGLREEPMILNSHGTNSPIIIAGSNQSSAADTITAYTSPSRDCTRMVRNLWP